MKRLLAIVMAGLLSACGVVGAPVAPEFIGVAPTVKRQQEQRKSMESSQREGVDADESDEPYPPLQGQDEDLPPLRPVGTR